MSKTWWTFTILIFPLVHFVLLRILGKLTTIFIIIKKYPGVVESVWVTTQGSTVSSSRMNRLYAEVSLRQFGLWAVWPTTRALQPVVQYPVRSRTWSNDHYILHFFSRHPSKKISAIIFHQRTPPVFFPIENNIKTNNFLATATEKVSISFGGKKQLGKRHCKKIHYIRHW